MRKIPKILPSPVRPNHLPESALWLAGEGAGSWFVLTKNLNNTFKIVRYSPKGNLECEGVFFTEQMLNLSSNFEIIYPSHCAVVTLLQGNEKIKLKIVKNENHK